MTLGRLLTLSEPHLPSQGKKRHLHLSQVPTFKQVVGLKQVNRIHAVAHHGLDEVGEVFRDKIRETRGLPRWR